MDSLVCNETVDAIIELAKQVSRQTAADASFSLDYFRGGDYPNGGYEIALGAEDVDVPQMVGESCFSVIREAIIRAGQLDLRVSGDIFDFPGARESLLDLVSCLADLRAEFNIAFIPRSMVTNGPSWETIIPGKPNDLVVVADSLQELVMELRRIQNRTGGKI